MGCEDRIGTGPPRILGYFGLDPPKRESGLVGNKLISVQRSRDSGFGAAADRKEEPEDEVEGVEKEVQPAPFLRPVCRRVEPVALTIRPNRPITHLRSSSSSSLSLQVLEGP